MAYARLEPFGQDYLHLMIAQQMIATGKLKRGTKVAELMPGEEPAHDFGNVDQEDLRRRLDATMAMIGAVRKN